MREIVTVKEAAARLGVAKSTVENWIARGKLVGLVHHPAKPAKQAKRFVYRDEVDALLMPNRQP